MPATAPPATSISTYNNGQPYRQPNGRAAAALPVVDHTATHHAIIRGTPTAARFIATGVEEMRLRNYARSRDQRRCPPLLAVSRRRWPEQ